MSATEVQRVGFEIAAVGTKGINPNDPDRRYTLRSLSGSYSGLSGSYSGLQLLCYM